MGPGADAQAVEIRFGRDGTLALVRTPAGITSGASGAGGLSAIGSMFRGPSLAGSVLPASPGSTVGGWGGTTSAAATPRAVTEAGFAPTAEFDGAADNEGVPGTFIPAFAQAGSTAAFTQPGGASTSTALAATLALVQQSEALAASLKVCRRV
jgi:hypothetical protein